MSTFFSIMLSSNKLNVLEERFSMYLSYYVYYATLRSTHRSSDVCSTSDTGNEKNYFSKMNCQMDILHIVCVSKVNLTYINVKII